RPCVVIRGVITNDWRSDFLAGRSERSNDSKLRPPLKILQAGLKSEELADGGTESLRVCDGSSVGIVVEVREDFPGLLRLFREAMGPEVEMAATIAAVVLPAGSMKADIHEWSDERISDGRALPVMET